MLTSDDFNKISTLLDSKLEEQLSSKLSPIKKQLNRIEKIVKTDFHYLDTRDIKIAKAVNRLETHLDIPVSEEIFVGDTLTS